MLNGEGPATRIEGLTLRGGHGTTSPAYPNEDRGGVVYLEGVSPTFVNCIIEGGANTSGGGGLASVGGSPRLVDCEVRGNQSDQFVGGMYFEGGSPKLTRVRVVGNWANNFSGGIGAFQSALTLEDCEIESNAAVGNGPGIYLTGSFAELTDCSIRQNGTLDGDGGGLFVDATSTAVLSDCVFVGNEACDHSGGAIFTEVGASLSFDGGRVEGNLAGLAGGLGLFGSSVVDDVWILNNEAYGLSSSSVGGGVSGGAQTLLRGCVITGNDADSAISNGSDGGGVFGPVRLERCTVAGNTASGVSGGVYNAVLVDSIVWGNVPPAPAANAVATYSAVEGGWPGIGNVSTDPLYFDFAAGDYHLLLGSPAIDAGDPASPLDPDGSRTDMGAFPHTPEHWVTYCTPGTSSAGCFVTLEAAGVASATASSGFTLSARSVEGQRSALFFFGSSGRQANPWTQGSGLQCVVPPVRRTALGTTSGVAGLCAGTLVEDLNARWCPSCPKPQHNPGPGAVVQAQLWYRDPVSTSGQGTSLSGAIEFQVQP